MNRIVLIDSYAQIFRGFYAVRMLNNREGTPTNAVFAMMRFLLKLENDRADYDGGTFVFDKGRPPHRMALAPDYKANRPPCPEELTVQLPVIRELITAFGWHLAEAENTEADDLIASITGHFSNFSVRIISADKDLAQLVDDRVEMLIPDQTGKGFARRGRQEVAERFGVPPEMIVDYLAMIGDSADNIPGIPGVGSKTAAKLLNQFGSITAMLEHADEITSPSLKEKIRNSGELLEKNIKLVRLVTAPPEGICWNEDTIRKNPPDWKKILEIAQQNDLNSMIREIEKHTDSLFSAPAQDACRKAPEDKPEKPAELEQMSLF